MESSYFYVKYVICRFDIEATLKLYFVDWANWMPTRRSALSSTTGGFNKEFLTRSLSNCLRREPAVFFRTQGVYKRT